MSRSKTALPSPTASVNSACSADPRPVTVAMVGAGQLARMTHQAAVSLGIELYVLAEDINDPAVKAGARHLVGSSNRFGDLWRLATEADVVTFDHERIPSEHIAILQETGFAVAPRAEAKLMAQDKLHARQTLAELGFPVPPFAHVLTSEEAERFAGLHGWPLVGKALRDGYDGRGVFELNDLSAVQHALKENTGGLLVEPLLELECELAVLVARSANGGSVVYPVAKTVQRNAMCREIVVPAPIDWQVADRATELALTIVERIDATGIVAVELFSTADGLFVNELALRPHNSGHYTIEGCVTSQFEQHLRAVLGWPLGSTELSAPAVVTVNVVGPPDGSNPADRITEALAVPGVHVHLYGKESRPGRKLGHVTVCDSEVQQAHEKACRAAALLEGSRQ